jgi:hypothetical protein
MIEVAWWLIWRSQIGTDESTGHFRDEGWRTTDFNPYYASPMLTYCFRQHMKGFCMHSIKESGKETGVTRKTGEVESLPSARQARKVTDIISAAKAILEDEAEDFSRPPAIQEPQPLDRQYLRKLRTLTVSMWILVIGTVLLALFVFTSPLHLGRYSRARYWADIILGISYITLGISVVATCASIVARNSLLGPGKSER